MTSLGNCLDPNEAADGLFLIGLTDSAELRSALAELKLQPIQPDHCNEESTLRHIEHVKQPLRCDRIKPSITSMNQQTSLRLHNAPLRPPHPQNPQPDLPKHRIRKPHDPSLPLYLFRKLHLPLPCIYKYLPRSFLPAMLCRPRRPPPEAPAPVSARPAGAREGESRV